MKTVFALGFFDGVHIGHQALLTACHHLAQQHGYEAGVVTFSSHPDTLVLGKTPLLINTVEDRQYLLLGHKISQIKVLPFDAALMNMSWQDFLAQLMEAGAAGFVCGHDFRFGSRGQGNAQLLADFCLQHALAYAVVPAQKVGGVVVSSTHIRKLLADGQMEAAVDFLGHPHVLSGTVVSGRQLGRTIGVPTANLHLPADVVVPKFGVYACKAIVDGREYLAVTNIGMRPTVGGHHVTVEAWLLDFEGDLYGKELTLLFYAFLRPEQKFGSLEALQTQIQTDAQKTKDFFKS